MKRSDVISEARKWQNVPWRHQGRSKLGVDCIGLVVLVGKALGVPHEDRTDYDRTPSGHTLLNHLRRFLTPVKTGSNLVGTIGVFRQSIFPCHVGIFSSLNGAPSVIHARALSRRVMEEFYINGENGLNLTEVLAFPGLED